MSKSKALEKLLKERERLIEKINSFEDFEDDEPHYYFLLQQLEYLNEWIYLLSK